MDNTSAFVQPRPLERLFNRIFGLLVGWGLGLSHNYLVQVKGRKSGRIYSMPVDVLGYRGKRYREKSEILKEYLNRYKTTVQRYFSVPTNAPLEAFSGIAWQYPVFELIAQ
jgi:hypothetical protein